MTPNMISPVVLACFRVMTPISLMHRAVLVRVRQADAHPKGNCQSRSLPAPMPCAMWWSFRVAFGGNTSRVLSRSIQRIISYEYLPNPHYRYTQPGVDEFDVVLADPTGIDGLGANIMASPQGALIGTIAHRYKKGTSIMITLKGGLFGELGCWHVNTTSRSQATAESLSLSTDDEVLPVAVVWRGMSFLTLAPRVRDAGTAIAEHSRLAITSIRSDSMSSCGSTCTAVRSIFEPASKAL